MKANRSLRENKKGVAPTLTILLVIPVILMVISAIALWAQNFIETMQELQDEIHEQRELLESLDIDDLVNNSNVIYIDGFEDSTQDDPQWNTYNQNGADPLLVGPETKANLSYYTGHLSGYINLDDGVSVNGLSGISRTFEEKCYGLVSIELAFTVSSSEDYKTISIYEDNNENIGKIKIDIENEELLLESSGTQLITQDVYLYSDALTWHTIKLIVDFENLEYVNFTLDGVTYDLTTYALDNPDPAVSKNPDIITFEYECSGEGETWVDDFVLCNLNPYKDIGIKWV